jgi:hypothetical protein
LPNIYFSQGLNFQKVPFATRIEKKGKVDAEFAVDEGHHEGIHSEHALWIKSIDIARMTRICCGPKDFKSDPSRNLGPGVAMKVSVKSGDEAYISGFTRAHPSTTSSDLEYFYPARSGRSDPVIISTNLQPDIDSIAGSGHWCIVWHPPEL